MKRRLSIFLLTVLPLLMTAQDDPSWGIKFSGFVKTDLIWDTRQTVDLREGHFLLYPKPVLYDPDSNDINAKASFNFLSIQSRVRADIKGPDALGAKTSGAIEAEFFGTSDADMNGFRLRLAFVKLNWKTTELMVGQFWHPMFITTSFPEVVSFNTGAPFLVFSRNPQIRLTQDFGHFRIIATALSQIDFKSPGPDGPNSKYLRNSAFPSMNLNFEYSKKDPDKKKEFLAGVAGNFKQLVPRLQTIDGYKTTEHINSFSGMAYVKFGFPKVIVKAAGLYGQNMFDYTMLGGYCVGEVTDTAKGFVSYTNITTLSAWTEVMTTGKKLMAGLFLGFSKNYGTGTPVTGPFYARGRDVSGPTYANDDIAYLFRISPRVIYNIGKFRLAPEIEYTLARYGNADVEDMVTEGDNVYNLRILLGVYYFF